ncbi:MerR family transcriptional regulator [Mucilaginibacter mali]|uniref:MerR family transcriptional regulator n=1 Tax=Mucilaginibacter mali TaxID=2740462 RepID=A0A7D4UBZ4_9SPHI|nr:chaperone modulator CbpM [Mucilaginibacter mali]QKJ28699.1 MerR family transcriptional regulator [Mucilaginibacter mali]
MATVNLISADEVCIHHQLETTFIHDLEHEGLIHISIVDKKTFIPADELPRLEKMIHLYRDLDINVPGIASIDHLLQQVDALHSELWALRNRLRLYEGE